MLAEGRGRARDRLAVDVREVDLAAGVRGLDLGRRRGAEGDRGDPAAREQLLAGARRAHLDTGRRRRRRRGENHPDRVGIRLVVDEAELEQPVDEIRRRGVRPDLPRARSPPARAQLAVDLLAHRLHLVGTEPEALRDVPARLVAAAQPEDVAVVDDPLVVRPERRVRVRVLRELDHLGSDHR